MAHEDIINKRGKNIPVRTPFSQELKKSIFMLIFTLLAIIVLVSIVYLLNSSQTTQKGYALKQQQLEKDQLNEESHDLVRKIIQAQSFKNIQNNPLVQNMIKPEKPVYLEEK